MYKIYKKFEFASAHKLEGHVKCGKLHGHSYLCEVTVSCGYLSEDFGFVLDFNFFSEIKKEYDHTDKIITISSEQLAEEIGMKILNKIKKERDDNDFNDDDVEISVKIWESSSSYAEYTV
jgi:6-pyruvoyltetrahydropterin/6-carboxytetrahydropterin synthase